MGGMQPDSFYNSQLFAFLFALGVYIVCQVLMNIVLSPAVKRMQELDSQD